MFYGTALPNLSSLCKRENPKLFHYGPLCLLFNSKFLVSEKAKILVQIPNFTKEMLLIPSILVPEKAQSSSLKN